MRWIYPFICASAFIVPSVGHAEVNCSDALVLDTYTSSSGEHINWAMASLVTEGQWRTISHDGSLNIVIYGVPVGATYKDYENNVKQMYHSESASFSKSDFENIAWTFLDPSGAKEYSSCVESQLNQLGIHLAVVHATATDVAIKVAYRKHGREADRIPVSWQWAGKTNSPLPKMIYAGDTTIVIPRPIKEMNFALNYQGIGDSIVLTPINTISKEPDKSSTPATVVESVVFTTDSEPSGACGGWSGVYTLCSNNEPADWKIVSSDFKLVGDRSCGAYSQCNKTVDTSTKICWQFQLQGHGDECSWHNNNTGIHNSQGILSTVWSHPDTTAAVKAVSFMASPVKISPYLTVDKQTK